MLGVTAALVGSSFLNSLLVQTVMGASPLRTGLYFLPGIAVVGFAAHIGPQLLRRAGSRAVVVAGMSLVGAAALLMRGAPARADYLTDLLPGLLLLGLGVGLVFVAVSVTAMADVADTHAGLASGLLTTSHDLGAALGVSLLSAVAFGSGIGSATGFVTDYGRGNRRCCDRAGDGRCAAAPSRRDRARFIALSAERDQVTHRLHHLHADRCCRAGRRTRGR
jgi:hypothetical protein